MMKGTPCLLLAIVLLPGCWTGGPLSKNRIAYKDDAVLWVYQTGGQIGVWGILLVPVSNELLDLQPGDACVHVTEGQTAGQCSATPRASLQVSHVLDVRTGHPAFACGPAHHVDHPTPVRAADRAHWETPVDDSLSVYSAGETGCLYLRLPSEVLVLHVRDPDPKVTYRPFLGVPMAAFRMPDDLLIVGLSQGYVVCIDMRKLHARSNTDAEHASDVGP